MQIKQENGGHAVIDQLTGEEVLTCAINIGEQLLMSGAESNERAGTDGR